MTPDISSRGKRKEAELAQVMDSGSLDTILEGWTCVMISNKTYESIWNYASGKGISFNDAIALAMDSLNNKKKTETKSFPHLFFVVTNQNATPISNNP
jgi:hypothetical protein